MRRGAFIYISFHLVLK